MKPTAQHLKEFIQQKSWHNQMASSRCLDSFSNYSGPDHGDLVVVSVGRNRDSEIMDESNFEAALEMLGGESDTVTVERFGHWGCGWFELILVDPKDKKALKIAYEIDQILKEYPILDDSDYSEREYEYHLNFAQDHASDVAKVLVSLFGLPEELTKDEQMLNLAIELNVECQRYYGNDSCLMSNQYQVDKFDDYDTEKYINCLKQMRWSSFSETEAYKLIAACFGLVDEAA